MKYKVELIAVSPFTGEEVKINEVVECEYGFNFEHFLWERDLESYDIKKCIIEKIEE